MDASRMTEPPTLTIAATDLFAADVVREYGLLCEANGCSREHLESVERSALCIADWQAANPTLVKSPD